MCDIRTENDLAHARDVLFMALKLAIPTATHAQLLAAVKAIEAFVSAKTLQVMSL